MLNRVIHLTFLILLFFSCKKKETVIELNEISKTGAMLTPDSIFNSIPFIEDVDTSFFPLAKNVGTPPVQHIIDMPPVIGQVGNTCVSVALGYYVLGQHSRNIDNPTYENDKLSSAYFIWANRGLFTQLFTDKMSIGEALEIARTKGCCRYSFLPNSSITESNISNLSTTNTQNTNALKYKVSYHFKFSTPNLSELKYHISHNYPIIALFNVDNSFLDFRNKGLINFIKSADGKYFWEKYIDNTRIPHAMTICGYDDSLSAFKIINSHSKDFANDGYFWLPYSKLSQMLYFRGSVPEMYVAKTEKPNSHLRGLIYSYPFIGNAKDVINNNNGLINGVTSTQDRWFENDAFKFQSGNYISTSGTNRIPAIGDSISYSFWIKGPFSGATSTIIMSGGFSINFLHSYTFNTSTFSYGQESSSGGGGSGGFNTANFNLDNGQWHHIAITSSKFGQPQLFVDGVLKGTMTSSLPFPIKNSSNQFKIGQHLTTGLNFTGSLDDIKVYSRVLTQQEINALKSE